MTNIKETNLQDLEYVSGGAAAEFSQLSSILVHSPVAKHALALEDNASALSNSELASFMKDTLAKEYNIYADFYLGANGSGLNIFKDRLSGKRLSYSDVLSRVIY